MALYVAPFDQDAERVVIEIQRAQERRLYIALARRHKRAPLHAVGPKRTQTPTSPTWFGNNAILVNQDPDGLIISTLRTFGAERKHCC